MIIFCALESVPPDIVDKSLGHAIFGFCLKRQTSRTNQIGREDNGKGIFILCDTFCLN
jgi:hypothetical protein